MGIEPDDTRARMQQDRKGAWRDGACGNDNDIIGAARLVDGAN